jgi:hypothetical protein
VSEHASRDVHKVTAAPCRAKLFGTRPSNEDLVGSKRRLAVIALLAVVMVLGLSHARPSSSAGSGGYYHLTLTARLTGKLFSRGLDGHLHAKRVGGSVMRVEGAASLQVVRGRIQFPVSWLKGEYTDHAANGFTNLPFGSEGCRQPFSETFSRPRKVRLYVSAVGVLDDPFLTWHLQLVPPRTSNPGVDRQTYRVRCDGVPHEGSRTSCDCFYSEAITENVVLPARAMSDHFSVITRATVTRRNPTARTTHIVTTHYRFDFVRCLNPDRQC